MLNTYDPGEVILTFGPIAISGFAEGSMINVAPLGEGDSAVVGSAGELARVRSRDERYEITVRLMATSPSCVALNAHMQLGNLSLPLSVTDIGRPRSQVAPDAFIKQQPGIEYSNEVPVQEWVFVAPKLTTIG